MKSVFHCLIFITGATAISVRAAPLDALLTADEYHIAGDFQTEASYDAVNDKVDVFKVRASDPVYGGTNVGDYSGGHLRIGYALTNRLMVEGSLWERRITYRTDNSALRSWLLAGQYHLLGDTSSTSHLDVRVSAWGDQADSMTKTSPTTVDGRIVTNVNINSLSDVQQQLDVISTWRLTGQTSASAYIGVGRSDVSTGEMTANYTNGSGCNYLLAFTQSGVTGERTNACVTSGPTLDTFSSSQNVLPDFSYKANYFQLGGMLQWRNQDWSIRGGYQYQKLQRKHVDELITVSGGTPYDTNHILVGEVMRKVSPHVALLLRGQAMSHQFVGEVPFVYNQITASKFSKRYGFASIGVVVGF